MTRDRGDGDYTDVALVGCPNVGKSAVFTELAGEYVTVSNYPGTTVETTETVVGEYRLIDTPGVYGISSFDEAERITRDIILSADAVIAVVDATQLDRDLFVVVQLLDMGIPTVIAVNMLDEAEAEGTTVELDALAARLEAPVVGTVAVAGEGTDELSARIPDATAPDSTPIETYLTAVPDDVTCSRAERTLLAEGDDRTVERILDGERRVDGGDPVAANLREEIYRDRRSRVASITDAVVREAGSDGRVGRLEELLIRPSTGTPIALVVLTGVFYLIGVGVAQTLVGFTETVVFGQYYRPAVTAVVERTLPRSEWAEPVAFLLLNDDLGLLTTTVQYVFGVLLPLVAAFHAVIGLLEDVGVLPRLAVLADRGLGRIGLNGRAVVPLIVGIGCVTMAVVTTRMAGSRRERLVATALLGVAIPCSAQIGVIMGLLAGLGVHWWLGYLAVVVGVLGVVGAVLDAVLPGDRQPLVTELPRLRLPRPRNVARKTVHRTRGFLSEASTLFAGTAVVVSGMDYLGLLAVLVDGLRPVTTVLGLPAEFGRVLVLGLIRRDFAAAGMTDLALSDAQTFVGLVVVTLFVPCLLSMATMVHERGWKAALVTWVGSWVVAFGVGGLVAAALGVIGA